MDREKLAELIERRASVYNDMRSLLDGAGDTGLSGEDEAKYERMEGEFDSLDKTIRRHEDMAKRDRSGDTPLLAFGDDDDAERAAARRDETRSERFERAMRPALAGHPEAVREFIGTAEYREAFIEGVLRGKLDVPEFRAALNLGVAAEGGITAPVEFQRQLLIDAQVFGVIRDLARVFSTSHGRDLEWAHLADGGSAGWVDETAGGGNPPESEPTFDGPLTLKAWAAMREIKSSRDLMQDSVFDIEGLIRELAAQSFAKLENPAFITGDGAGKPTGFVAGVPTANVHTGAAGQVAAIIADDLIDVQHSLPRPYRRNATWLLNDQTLKAVRKLKDANDQYLWQPGLQAGQSGTILGKPYEIDDDMPDMAASARPIVYGDFRSAYWIRDVLDLTVQRLNELYARSRQIGWLFTKRVDGKLMVPQALAAYENPAV